MSIIQILIIIFALFALSRAFLRLKDKLLKIGEFIFWAILWIAVIVAALFPDLTSSISSVFGIGRGVDFVIYVSIIILFYLIYRIYVKLDEQDQKISILMREFTIREHKKK